MKLDSINLDNIVVRQEKRLGHNERINILDVPVDVLTMSETISLVEKYIKTKTPLHLMGVNADKINLCSDNKKIKEIVKSCGVITADGSSVVMAGKYLGFQLHERIAGIDLMDKLVELADREGYTIYLLGATEEVVKKTEVALEEKYKDLKCIGRRNGYFNDDEWPEIAKMLLEKNPDLVFVGITSPKKEYLIEYLQNAGVRAVMMGVGGSFDVISGKIPRAPRWMQRCGLEWLFRVLNEPRRLFKRYFVGNRRFIKAVRNERKKRR